MTEEQETTKIKEDIQTRNSSHDEQEKKIKINSGKKRRGEIIFWQSNGKTGPKRKGSK